VVVAEVLAVLVLMLPQVLVLVQWVVMVEQILGHMDQQIL
jgi:hypothetical protein|tara:strand:+ start:371 stop:490 length:120 start_codon:yes stop_codon:yes gene_type:complete